MFWVTVAAFAANRFRDHPFGITALLTLSAVLIFDHPWEIMAPILIANVFMGMFALPTSEQGELSYPSLGVVFALSAIGSPWVMIAWLFFQLYEDDWKHNFLIFNTVPLNVAFLTCSSFIYWITHQIFTHEEQQHVYGALVVTLIGFAIKNGGKKTAPAEQAQEQK